METCAETGSDHVPMETDICETVWVRMTCAVETFDGKLTGTGGTGEQCLDSSIPCLMGESGA